MKKVFTLIVILIGISINQNLANAFVPAELVSFDVKCSKEKIFLEWATASEMNLSNFELYRAIVKDASPLEFIKIDDVKAKGMSSSLTKYGPIIDSNVNSGLYYYYKLKLIDNDGASSFSNEILIFVEKDTTTSVDKNDSDITFEIFNNSSSVKLSSSIEIDFELNLYSYDGRFVETIRNYKNFVGVDEIYLLNYLKQTGVYFIEFQTKNKRITKKIILN